MHNWRIRREIFEEEEIILPQENQPSLSSLVTNALFQNMTLLRSPISRSHWNEESTKEICIFSGLQNYINLLKLNYKQI